MPLEIQDRFRGALLGTAIGDSLGLPAEGLSPQRARRLLRGPWRQRLVLGYGMVSDDTDHAVFVAQSLLAHPHSAEAFTRRLAWCLRAWLVSLPAGIGLATLRATLKLWLGVPPTRSGVFSAGNGPAMRAPLIGAFFADDPERLDAYLTSSTRMTHTDPRALLGARAVAHAAVWTVRGKPRPTRDEFFNLLEGAAAGEPEWLSIVNKIDTALASGASVADLAGSMGLGRGVTGYIYHTVPVVLYAWHVHHGDFEQSLTAVLDCGGDSDTTGAIIGALAGLAVGEEGIPRHWCERLLDWPRGRGTLRRIGERLAQATHGSSPGPAWYPAPLFLLRNLFFLEIVLAHGLRRLLPPF